MNEKEIHDLMSVFAADEPHSFEDTKTPELVLSIPLHENQVVLDYIETKSFNGFDIRRQPDKLTMYVYDPTILTVLQRTRIVKDDEHTSDVELDLMTLLPKRNHIKKSARDYRWQYEPEIIDLTETLNAIHAFSDPAVKKRLDSGQAHYSDLPVLFPRGKEVIAQTASGMLGGIVDTCTEMHTFFGNYYNISMSVILPTSKGASVGKVNHRIYDFDGSVMPITKLGIRPITAEEKVALVERGKKFREFTASPTPATYSGNLTIPGWFRDKVFNADGRIMVDSVNFAHIDSDLYFEIMRAFEIDEETAGDVKEEDLWRCYTRVHGFSMRLKRWGWLEVDGINHVKWRNDAFNQLVLEPGQKKSMLNLVKYYGDAFTDFIEGKSGGLVFLLHGPTGVGKTLSAEAVAETLHRPLYSVSVGELGVNPNELEERLRAVLDLAYQWNAVLLLDEADIFMEARDTNNIERNAMVSIFLRLLEYYSGVLFLTTNRVKTFDPAFYSRISLAISYPKLDDNTRKNVWKNILLTSGVAESENDFNPAHASNFKFDLDTLAAFNVNGRNIKTAIRIVQTMAVAEDRPVSMDDLVDHLRRTEKFNEDVNI